MTPDCRDKLVKIIPMLMSENDSEVVATVSAIKRILLSNKLTMHDLASSISVGKPKAPKANYYTADANKSGPLHKPDNNQLMHELERFRRSAVATTEDARFMDSVYIDLNILKENYYMSQLELARYNEIKRRYRI